MAPRFDTLRRALAGPPAPRRRRRWIALAVAGSSLAAVRTRKKLGFPGALTTAWAFAAPVAMASGFKRSRARDAAVWLAQMWAYKNAFELPHDDEQRLRRRTHVDYLIEFDRRIGGGIPPGQRLQRRLRRRGGLTVLDKALSFFYWTWEAEPHLVMGWIRWCRPEDFAAAAGRLAAISISPCSATGESPRRRRGGRPRRPGGWTVTSAG